MEYRTLHGGIYNADSYDELAKLMWHADRHAESVTVEDWMVANADEVKRDCGKILRTDTTEHHIQDMIAAGLLKVGNN